MKNLLILTVLMLCTNLIIAQTNPKTVDDFGANPWDEIDDTDSIQKAIDYAFFDHNQNKTTGRALHPIIFNAGTYIISKPLVFPKKVDYLIIKGQGMGLTMLKIIGNNNQNLFEFDRIGFSSFEDFYVQVKLSNNQGLKNVFHSPYGAHLKFERIRTTHPKHASISIGWGFCNSYRNCVFQWGKYGIEFIRGQNNAAIFDNCSLSGMDVGLMASGMQNSSVKLSNCVFEKIHQTAIFANGTSNLDIDNCYFEEVASEGYPLNVTHDTTIIKDTIKAAIILNGGGDKEQSKAMIAYPNKSVKISNSFISPYCLDYFVFAISVRGLKIENNSTPPVKSLNYCHNDTIWVAKEAISNTDLWYGYDPKYFKTNRVFCYKDATCGTICIRDTFGYKPETTVVKTTSCGLEWHQMNWPVTLKEFTLLGMYADGNKSLIDEATINDNVGFKQTIDLRKPYSSNQYRHGVETITIKEEKHHNYLEDISLEDWQSISVQVGDISEHTTSTSKYPIYKMATGQNRDVTSNWGFIIDAHQYPELQNKYCVFMIQVKRLDDNARFLRTGYHDEHGQYKRTNGDSNLGHSWELRAITFKMPYSGTIKLGVHLKSHNKNEPAEVMLTQPVLCSIGGLTKYDVFK